MNNYHAMENDILISVKALSRSYGQHQALVNVSFDVHRGEILGFLGPNGAGKSTTMQIISGVLGASHGSVEVAGYDIKSAPKQAKKHIGFLPEQPPLYHDLTVDEYLCYTAKLRGINNAQLQQAVAVSKQRCGLDSVSSRLIRNLSKGYKQRIGIAQAIVHAPPVIILDEPTAGLDPIQIREIRSLMRELASHHSIILSTHILSEVQGICDRVLIINQGQLVLNQTLDQLQHNKDMPSSIELGLRQPPPLTRLEDIAGVAAVERINEGLFNIQFDKAFDGTETIVTTSIKEQWGLYKLNPIDTSLEAIFMQLTHGDNTPPSDPIKHDS